MVVGAWIFHSRLQLYCVPPLPRMVCGVLAALPPACRSLVGRCPLGVLGIRGLVHVRLEALRRRVGDRGGVRGLGLLVGLRGGLFATVVGQGVELLDLRPVLDLQRRQRLALLLRGVAVGPRERLLPPSIGLRGQLLRGRIAARLHRRLRASLGLRRRRRLLLVVIGGHLALAKAGDALARGALVFRRTPGGGRLACLPSLAPLLALPA